MIQSILMMILFQQEDISIPPPGTQFMIKEDGVTLIITESGSRILTE